MRTATSDGARMIPTGHRKLDEYSTMDITSRFVLVAVVIYTAYIGNVPSFCESSRFPLSPTPALTDAVPLSQSSEDRVVMFVGLTKLIDRVITSWMFLLRSRSYAGSH